VAVKARIPVELYFDDDLGTWHFHVDEPRITGGGQATVGEAREAAAEAIAFALTGTARRRGAGRIEYVEVALSA